MVATQGPPGILTLPARAVLSGQFDLRTYPFNYLAVSESPGWLMTDGVPVVLSAADYLAHWGWDLVTMSQVGKTLFAVMRRR